MKRFSWAALAAVLLLSGVAWAAIEVDSGAVYWVRRQAFSASGCVQESASDTTCALFPAGKSRYHRKRLVSVSSDAALGCSFSGEDGAAVAGVEITDTGGEYGNGPEGAAGFWVGALQAFEDQPSRETMRTQGNVGARTGLCTNTRTSGGDVLHAPCDADNDCTAYGGGSCDLTPTDTLAQTAGVFLICAPDTGTANAVIIKKRMPDDA